MSRYFENKYISLDSARIDPNAVSERITSFVQTSHSLLSNHLKEGKKDGYSLYTGLVGVAMTVHRINTFQNPKFRNNYSRLLDLDIKIHSLGEGSFERIGLASNEICPQLYQCLKEDRAFDVVPLLYKNKFSSFELLTGKAGLALMVKYFTEKGLKLSNPDLVEDIIESIPMEEFPWSWHKKVYYGAAHGTAGIMHAMNRILGDHSSSKKPEYIDFLMSEAYIPSSGNFRSSEGSDKDVLVQWCHGSPGVIPLLLENLHHPSCRATLQPVLDDIWHRGLLKKGGNICHGISGNGYAFLAAYVQLGHQEYLDRALCFADYILSMAESGGSPLACCERADHPYSLFEGLAGVVHYLLDIQAIIKATDSDKRADFPLDFQCFDNLEIF
jgi:hypothetical protein